MNYGAIKKCDIANGVGVRTVLFVSGKVVFQDDFLKVA